MLNIMTTGTVRLVVPELLRAGNISTKKFADGARLTYNQALALRRGVYTRIDLDTIGRVAEFFGKSVGELFETVPEEGDR
jgi:hypothetical protein